MKKQKRFSRVAVCLLLILVGLGAGVANASSTPPNLSLQITGPSSAQVYSPYQYTVTVTNIGGSTAYTSSVVVDLPETTTSPQKYVLGTVSGYPQTCQLANRKLVCQLGNVTHTGPNRTKSFSFTFAFPISTRSLQIKATASTVTTPETNSNNNFATIAPTPVYPNNQLTSATMSVSNCTGTTLSSFFECELFPSSQQHFTLSLNPDLTMSYEGQFIGNWDQYAGANRLHFVLFMGNGTAEFNGFARSNTCFEGITTFSTSTTYISPYRLCIQ
ncbi:MAG: hypothetical protein JSS81_21770 [Acidobacteria bacterium]|nr:hypothetical protein [Acidobacteriota bacterium]